MDPDAVAAATENARRNGVEIAVSRADFLADELPSADLAVANVTLASVEDVAMRVLSTALIASGYVASEQPQPPGWSHQDRREDEGWAADVFVRS
jgi:ribosomal protein L11 methylase PrmA